jgi:hypothetical protein
VAAPRTVILAALTLPAPLAAAVLSALALPVPLAAQTFFSGRPAALFLSVAFPLARTVARTLGVATPPVLIPIGHSSPPGELEQHLL